ncbi:hypothetical protein [Sinorhizobium meliloti]|uniref:hypothetical protein n=1 Tax=Rhizobium meliloti TaxID=382 RepID=UPI000FD6F2CB|nr:hypothetical protein [Sinorhizobium meliloti]RVJ58237.1 hypothetical protein CN175_01845 [Sinorhizobium meliloti]
MQVKDARILILCKTYPSPSGKYTETSCVAGMDEVGSLIRLFPVPFRLITKEQQFKKWQWIKAKVRKAKNDRRPESHNILIDTIIGAEEVSAKREWTERRRLLSKLQPFSDFGALEDSRKLTGRSIGLLRPARIVRLEIVPVAHPNWTDEELAKLEQEQQQGGLFDKADKRSIRATLRKLPYDFYYRYECDTAAGIRPYRHKIVDWEAGALYWNCFRRYGQNWETGFREQLEKRLPSTDLTLLMGNIHRFQDQWLIISLIYPPKQNQGSLL